eukprot:1271759-Rhodomonas_salina.1
MAVPSGEYKESVPRYCVWSTERERACVPGGAEPADEAHRRLPDQAGPGTLAAYASPTRCPILE